MKLSEIKTSVIVALMKSVSLASNEDEPGMINIHEDVGKQCEAVGNYYGNLFLLECLEESEQCLKNNKKFDKVMNKFKDVGPRFSTEIEAG